MHVGFNSLFRDIAMFASGTATVAKATEILRVGELTHTPRLGEFAVS